jgi:hypothetical protein
MNKEEPAPLTLRIQICSAIIELPYRSADSSARMDRAAELGGEQWAVREMKEAIRNAKV